MSNANTNDIDNSLSCGDNSGPNSTNALSERITDLPKELGWDYIENITRATQAYVASAETQASADATAMAAQFLDTAIAVALDIKYRTRQQPKWAGVATYAARQLSNVHRGVWLHGQGNSLDYEYNHAAAKSALRVLQSPDLTSAYRALVKDDDYDAPSLYQRAVNSGLVHANALSVEPAVWASGLVGHWPDLTALGSLGEPLIAAALASHERLPNWASIRQDLDQAVPLAEWSDLLGLPLVTTPVVAAADHLVDREDCGGDGVIPVTPPPTPPTPSTALVDLKATTLDGFVAELKAFFGELSEILVSQGITSCARAVHHGVYQGMYDPSWHQTSDIWEQVVLAPPLMALSDDVAIQTKYFAVLEEAAESCIHKSTAGTETGLRRLLELLVDESTSVCEWLEGSNKDWVEAVIVSLSWRLWGYEQTSRLLKWLRPDIDISWLADLGENYEYLWSGWVGMQIDWHCAQFRHVDLATLYQRKYRQDLYIGILSKLPAKTSRECLRSGVETAQQGRDLKAMPTATYLSLDDRLLVRDTLLQVLLKD